MWGSRGPAKFFLKLNLETTELREIKTTRIKKYHLWDFSGGPVRRHLPTQGTWVPSFVREYKMHTPQSNKALKLPQETSEPTGHKKDAMQSNQSINKKQHLCLMKADEEGVG